MAALLSNFLRCQRLGMVTPYLRGDVLDVGCGITDIPRLLQPSQCYVGVDRADIVRWLRENRPVHTYHVCDLDQKDLALNGQFDTILLMAVIEHLKNPDRLLAQLPAYLKPDGRLLITTPSPFGNTLHRIGACLGLFHSEAAREHETIFTRAHLQERLAQHGFEVLLYRQFLLGGNQLFVCQPP